MRLTPYLSIPEDQWQIVLSFITCSDLLNLALVSKHLKFIAMQTHHLITESSSIPGFLSRSVPNVNNIDPMSSFSAMSFALNSNSTVPNPYDVGKELQLTHLLDRFKYLRKIILQDLSSLEDFVLPIINSSPAACSLQHVELHDVRILRDRNMLQLPGEGNTLTHVVISGSLFCSYQRILSTFATSSNLQLLQIDGSRLLSDADTQNLIATRGRNNKLRTLSLSNSSKLFEPTIECTVLRSLDLSYCSMLSDLANIRCPNLRELNLTSSSSLTDSAISSVCFSCPMLEQLNLTGAGGISMLELISNNLKVLNLNLCTKLEIVDLVCGNLDSLEVRFNTN